MSPEKDGFTIDTSPILRWADVEGADSYNIRYSLNENEIENVPFLSVDEPNYQIQSIFSYDDEVFWQVYAVKGNGNSCWSAVHSFTISNNVIWTGISPNINTTIEDTTPLLNWNTVDGALKYELRYSNDDIGLDEADIIECDYSEFQIPLSRVFALSDTCYWQVRAINKDEVACAWSNIFTFNINWNINWSGFQPEDNESINDVSPVLKWNEIPNAYSYDIRFADSESALSTAIISNQTNTVYQYPSTLSDGDRIYWQVRAVNSDGVSSIWSDVLSFDVSVGVPEETVLFYDDFSGDLSAWNVYSTDSSYDISITNTDGMPAPALLTNDYATYGCWAITKQLYEYSGNTISFSTDLRHTSSGNSDQAYSRFHLTQTEVEPGGVCSMMLIGATNPNNPNTVQCRLIYNDGEDKTEESGNLPITDGDSWHNCKIRIMDTGVVEFYLDNNLVYTSSNSITDSYTDLGVAIGCRRSNYDNCKIVLESDNSSSDFLQWTQYSSNPIIIASDVPSELSFVDTNHSAGGFWGGQAVIYDDNKYKMWMTGWRTPEKQTIGYATSDNGYDWVFSQGTQSGGSVIQNGTSTYYNAANPCVIKDGSIFKMWYVIGNNGFWHYNYATSSDGIIWSYHGTVLSYSDSGSFGFENTQPGMSAKPSVIKEADGTYKMWFVGNNSGVCRIGLATSVDGINWTRVSGGGYSGSVLDLGDSSKFDSSGVKAPTVYKDGDTYRMLYYGHSSTLETSGYGYATSSDGISWEKQYNSNRSDGAIDGFSRDSGEYPFYYWPTIMHDGISYKLFYSFYNNTSERYMIGCSNLD